MTEQFVRAALEHPKRKLLVIIATIVMTVMFGIPAVEEYMGARARSAIARDNLSTASTAVERLPTLQGELARIQSQLQALESKAVTRQTVERMREGELQAMIRESGCQMREVKIDETPVRRDWQSNDSPLQPAAVGTGKPTAFELVQWHARVRIEGPMVGIYRFLERVGQMDRFAHTRLVEMQRASANESLTQLRMEFSLFDLARKSPSKSEK